MIAREKITTLLLAEAQLHIIMGEEKDNIKAILNSCSKELIDMLAADQEGTLCYNAVSAAQDVVIGLCKDSTAKKDEGIQIFKSLQTSRAELKQCIAAKDATLEELKKAGKTFRAIAVEVQRCNKAKHDAQDEVMRCSDSFLSARDQTHQRSKTLLAAKAATLQRAHALRDAKELELERVTDIMETRDGEFEGFRTTIQTHSTKESQLTEEINTKVDEYERIIVRAKAIDEELVLANAVMDAKKEEKNIAYAAMAVKRKIYEATPGYKSIVWPADNLEASDQPTLYPIAESLLRSTEEVVVTKDILLVFILGDTSENGVSI